MIRNSFLILSLNVIVCFSALVASAQARPEAPFSTRTAPAIAVEKESFIVDNPYFSDVLKLQNQILLLQEMVERQQQLSQIERAYIDLGVAFNQPAPPEKVCQELPPNPPCAAAYPGLYPADAPFTGIAVDRRAPDLPPVPVFDETDLATLAPPELPSIPAPAVIEDTPPPVRRSEYQWADISCVAGTCKAVVSRIGQPSTRWSVAAGDELPDGSKITDISTEGVLVALDGQSITLEPAPSPAFSGSVGGGVSPSSFEVAPGVQDAIDQLR